MFFTSDKGNAFVIRDFTIAELLTVCILLPTGLGYLAFFLYRILVLHHSIISGFVVGIVYSLIAFAASIRSLPRIKFRKTEIDANTQTLRLRSWSLFGYKESRYHFADVSKTFGGLCVNTDYVDSDNRVRKVYGIQLALASGESVDLTSYAWLYHGPCEVAVEKANKLISGEKTK